MLQLAANEGLDNLTFGSTAPARPTSECTHGKSCRKSRRGVLSEVRLEVIKFCGARVGLAVARDTPGDLGGL